MGSSPQIFYNKKNLIIRYRKMPKKLALRKKAKKFKKQRAKPNNLKTFNVNIESYYILKNNGGAVADISDSIALNHPTYHRDTTNAWVQMTPKPDMLDRCLALFDQYKVNSLTVRYLANYLDTEALGTGGAEAPNIMYHLNDNNDCGLPDEAAVLNGGILPTPVNTNRYYTFKFKQLKQMKNRYVDCLVMGNNPGSTVPNNQSILPEEFYAGMKLMFPNTLPTTWLGRLYCKWNVTFRGVSTEFVA